MQHSKSQTSSFGGTRALFPPPKNQLFYLDFSPPPGKSVMARVGGGGGGGNSSHKTPFAYLANGHKSASIRTRENSTEFQVATTLFRKFLGNIGKQSLLLVVDASIWSYSSNKIYLLCKYRYSGCGNLSSSWILDSTSKYFYKRKERDGQFRYDISWTLYFLACNKLLWIIFYFKKAIKFNDFSWRSLVVVFLSI